MSEHAHHRRVVLACAAVVAGAVLVALGVVLAQTQRDSRRTVEKRFADGSVAAASLIQTVVGQALASDTEFATARMTARRVTTTDMAAASARLNGATLILLDGDGRRIAAFPPSARPAAGDQAHLRAALRGTPGVSGLLGSGRQRRIEIAVPFAADDGRRALVIATPRKQLQDTLGPYLAGLPGLRGHHVFLLDAAHVPLAASEAGLQPDPSLVSALARHPGQSDGVYAGGRRQFSVAPIRGTTWQVAETVRRSVLYSPVDGWSRVLPWVVLAVLLAAGGVIVLLADRAGRAAQRARQASEAKSAFLASMSHELRTPMTTVIGFSEMLSKGQLGELSERQQEVVGHIHNSSKHLNTLIAEVLDLSRVEEGRMTFHPVEVRPHLLVAEVVESMSGLAADRGVRLSTEAPDIGVLLLDPARFKQVLYNLVGNAINYSEGDGTVTVRLWRDEYQELGVEVTDTGPGIHAEDLERIFLPFEQGTGHRDGGAGLGLAISRRIVDAQGGRLGVRSRLGEGSTFTLTLPAPPTTGASGGADRR
jgi:signal transduction histidine kinase